MQSEFDLFLQKLPGQSAAPCRLRVLLRPLVEEGTSAEQHGPEVKVCHQAQTLNSKDSGEIKSEIKYLWKGMIRVERMDWGLPWHRILGGQFSQSHQSTGHLLVRVLFLRHPGGVFDSGVLPHGVRSRLKELNSAADESGHNLKTRNFESRSLVELCDPRH